MADPYRWLEDGQSAECARWLEDQDALFAGHASGWPWRQWFRAALDDAVSAGGAATPAATPPVWRGRRRFFLRRLPSQSMAVLMVADGDADARALVDPTGLDATATTTLDAWRPSWSGELLACQLSRGGSERPDLWVTSVSDGRVVDGPLTPGRRTPVAWLPGDGGFYYVTDGDSGGRQLRCHHVGTPASADPTVFATELAQLTVKISPDGRWLMLSAAGGATSGNVLWLAALDPNRPHAVQPQPVHDGRHDNTRAVLKFGPGPAIHALTDARAPHGRLCAVDPAEPTAWRTLVDEQPPAVLSDTAVLADPDTGATRLLVCRSRHGVSELTLHEDDGTPIGPVALPGHGTVSQLTAPHGGQDAWFSYTDYLTAPTIHCFRSREGRCVPDPAPPPQPTGAAADAAVAQLCYPSADGTRVRMHLISPPGDAGGPRPTLLTGYGGFGASTILAYSPAIHAWIRAGGRYAVAHLRGGGEEGAAWHAAGRAHNKPNAVADLTAAAQWLIGHGWTTPAQLVVKGGSHGGLMAAAALVAHPELYAAAVCSGAVTDMLRYHHFGLGHLWTDEFGTAEDPAALDTLLRYSPYHGVRPGTEYPAVLLTCPRVDPRVDSLHTRKLTAALQHATTSPRPVLLRCEANAGHGPATTTQWVDLQADILAFCAAHTNLQPHTKPPGT